MTRIVIVHRWDGNPSSDWYQWLKKELENKGYEVLVPAMPNTAEPNIQEWVSALAKEVKDTDENTYFVGHSIGCQTILRFLEQAQNPVGGVVFVAGWFHLDNLESDDIKTIAKPWLETPLKFDIISRKIPSLTVFLSSNDPYGKLKENQKIFQEKLQAHVIIEKNKGHYTTEDHITQVPQVLNALLLKIMK
ncbi:MAG: alpha/beta fold hydrolase [Nanoarchaeota archaeon]